MPSPLDSARFLRPTKCPHQTQTQNGTRALSQIPGREQDPAGRTETKTETKGPGHDQATRGPVHLAGRYHLNWPICAIPVRPFLNQSLCMRTRPSLVRALAPALLLVCLVCAPGWPDTHDSDYPARAYPAFTPAPACGGAIAQDSMRSTTSVAAPSGSACPRASQTIKPKLILPRPSSRPTFSRKTNRTERASL
jgi:hypothetical protein